MSAIAIEQIIQEVKDLPTLPGVVMELLNTIDQDDMNINELAQKVSRDIALTAKTLRYANSVYYATMVKVATIPQAITLLGLDTFKQMVMIAALSGCFPENKCKGFSHKRFWYHSNAVAIAAKILARRLNFNLDLAFTAGLLHDIGSLVLVTHYLSEYEATIAFRLEHQVTQFEAERQVLGIDHAVVGEALANQWQFSELMAKAIGGHHQPDKPGLGFLATIVHVADGIAHALNISTTPDHTPPEISGQAWESLGLDQASLEEVLAEAQLQFDKLNAEMDV
ncbi:putative nucleotidyltransferase with HDIG domain [Undibacterium sp. GrIS 1.8]|uniref:HDOD domain-containing protein n=1 Tax=Undibacterium sp. GrIS 1.8 TaxID=3143934 RepID=UPI00339A0120